MPRFSVAEVVPGVGGTGCGACSQVLWALSLSPELRKLSCRAELTPSWPIISRMSRGQS